MCIYITGLQPSARSVMEDCSPEVDDSGNVTAVFDDNVDNVDDVDNVDNVGNVDNFDNVGVTFYC